MTSRHQELLVTLRYNVVFYACRYGHLEAITVLLNEGECSPNITTDTGSSPLHFAAANGHPYVVELLLNHPDIDVVRIRFQLCYLCFVHTNIVSIVTQMQRTGPNPFSMSMFDLLLTQY